MRVIVGMSGGVDSSVAALLLKQQGHEVIGVFMKNWEDDEGCTAQDDYDDARKVCDVIGIPYYSVNFSETYRQRVFEVFLREYRAGRTPNPDVLCNTEVKFNAFLEFAMRADCDALATGHYAQLRTAADGRAELLRGADANKDQTYFLCGLQQEQLQKAMFPVGHLQKSEVRRIAREAGLPTADKKDSTGICFIGERKFTQFIAKYIPSQPGDMVDIDTGKVIAEHEGLSRYTIGQRKGIGIGGQGTGEPWFVAGKDVEQNRLLICQGKSHPALFSRGLITEGFHWIGGEPTEREFRCTAKFRYRQQDIAALVTVGEQGIELHFDAPARAVTPGQYAVLYQDEVCLGGGVIQCAKP